MDEILYNAFIEGFADEIGIEKSAGFFKNFRGAFREARNVSKAQKNVGRAQESINYAQERINEAAEVVGKAKKGAGKAEPVSAGERAGFFENFRQAYREAKKATKGQGAPKADPVVEQTFRNPLKNKKGDSFFNRYIMGNSSDEVLEAAQKQGIDSDATFHKLDIIRNGKKKQVKKVQLSEAEKGLVRAYNEAESKTKRGRVVAGVGVGTGLLGLHIATSNLGASSQQPQVVQVPSGYYQ